MNHSPVFDPLTYLHQPFEVSIETMTICNAACTFCTYPDLDRKNTSMPTELIFRMIEEMASFEHPFFFSPFKVNEPFLDRRTILVCEAMNLKVPRARLRLFTNGTPLTAALIEQIAKLRNVEHLWVSLNSTDHEEYEAVMKLPFYRTADKLDALHRTVAAGYFPHEVVLSRVSGTRDQDIKFMMDCMHRWPQFEAFLIKRDGWLGDIDAPEVMIPAAPCVRWWELSIMSTGVVALCCMDGTGKFKIGDVSKDSLLEVYNHPSYLLRRQHRLSRKEVFPCSTCSY